MTVEVGATAPEFTLKDYNNEQVSLSDFRGRKAVLLVFYPFAFSPVCTGELFGVRDDIGNFANDDVQVVGVSVDTPFSLKAWSKEQGYDFPLLSDFWPHGEVARRYGVLRDDAGCAIRGTFLVGPRGTVRWTLVHGPGEARDLSGFDAALPSPA
jgi:peroxiredoxin (alkyl hydroperoxide reductase subunit C)